MIRTAAIIAGLAAVAVAWAPAQEDSKTALVEKCRADAAGKAGVPAAEVTTVLVEEVTWRSGALGCPQPGMDYTAVMVPGYRIVLQAGGKVMRYHTDRQARLVLCEDPQTGAEGGEEQPPTPPANDGEPGPPGAEVGVLVIEPVAGEPNGNGKLVLKQLEGGGGDTTVLEKCSAFAVSSGGAILAKRRVSRSRHELLLIERPGEQPEVLTKAFDFEALSFLGSTPYFVFLASAGAGQRAVLHAGWPGQAPQPVDWAPTAPNAQGATATLAGDILVLDLPADGDGRVIALDLTAQKLRLDVAGTGGAPIFVSPTE